MEYSEADCLEALLEAAERLNRAPTMDEYDSLGLSPTAQTIASTCGTWRIALAKAGLEREPRREYTEQNCINAIQNAADILDEEPSINSYKELGLNPSVTTIAKIFGTWSAAKEAAGVTDCGDQSPREEAETFFEKLEQAEPTNRGKSNQEDIG